jgi:hypothetical protein
MAAAATTEALRATTHRRLRIAPQTLTNRPTRCPNANIIGWGREESGEIRRTIEMKKLSAVVLAAMAVGAAPIAMAPVAGADVCGDVGGRHVSVGGCTNVAGDVATGAAVAGAATADDAAAQAAAGQPPCYTPQGVPYYTPGDAPCN